MIILSIGINEIFRSLGLSVQPDCRLGSIPWATDFSGSARPGCSAEIMALRRGRAVAQNTETRSPRRAGAQGHLGRANALRTAGITGSPSNPPPET
jgi:hypothetical protein